jgi:hypothetical protein
MQPETTEKPFRCDCVKLTRAIRNKIYEETKYMTDEEQMERTRRASVAFRADIDRRRAEIEAAKQS